MAHNTRSNIKPTETSEQGALRMVQQNFTGFMEGSDQKFAKLQEQMDLMLRGMTGLMNSQVDDEIVVTEGSEDELEDEITGSQPVKGVFRDPNHAAKLRQKNGTFNRKKKKDEQPNNPVGGGEGLTDVASLKHLKLTFPSLKEGGDAVEWLRDCEEYFAIFEVTESRRPAIAAMHMSGTPRYWYKSFMVGKEKVTWTQFTQAFLARFGELDTELVFLLL